MVEKAPYDPASKQSIYHYAVNLRGSTLREKSHADEIADIRKNKGSFGSAVETHYFMLDLNNESEADFKEAGLELKTTPLKRSTPAGSSGLRNSKSGPRLSRAGRSSSSTTPSSRTPRTSRRFPPTWGFRLGPSAPTSCSLSAASSRRSPATPRISSCAAGTT